MTKKKCYESLQEELTKYYELITSEVLTISLARQE
jgi:hypothetical protein